jgi:hypothetical protein
MVYPPLKTEPGDSNLADILDRILDKGIVLEPWARIVSATTDLRGMNKANRIIVTPERRHKPFVVPASKPRSDPS